MNSKTPFTAGLTVLLIILLLWEIGLFIQEEKDTPWNFLYNVGYSFLFLAGGSAGIFYAKRFSTKSTLGKALAFTALSLMSWWLGLLVWTYYNLVLQVEVPYPSLADGLFILFYPFLGLGVWYFLKIFRPLVTRTLIVDSILIILVVSAITFSIYAPDLTDLSLAQRFFSLAYPIGDVIMLSAALITLRIGGGRIQKGLLILVVGIFIQTAADYAFTYRTNNEIYWNGDVADLLYTLSAFTLSLGIVNITKAREFKEPAQAVSSVPAQPTA